MKCINYGKILFSLLKICILSLLTGLLGGLVGAAFSHTLSFVTDFREGTPWIILLLPVGGVLTVLLYKAFKMSDHKGTNEIILCLKEKSKIRTLAAPLIFISTAITHLFGGSAGREGAAIQLGGAGASALSDVLHLKDDNKTVITMCGMSAVFSGVFGTPLTAAFFILEFKSNRKTLSLAAIPCFISAIAAKIVASYLGVAEEAFHLKNTTFSLNAASKILVLAVALSILGTVMCFCFEKAQIWAKKLISNSIIRAIVFSVVIIGLTAIVGDMRYNGSGMNMVISSVEGTAYWFDFILKIVFTSITLAAGFKGGEIVPTFCIGATFGCVLGSALGLDAGLSAAIGLVGLFCYVTNSLISAVFLGFEMFGISALPCFVIVCILLWIFSVNEGLFENRFFKSPVLKIIEKINSSQNSKKKE